MGTVTKMTNAEVGGSLDSGGPLQRKLAAILFADVAGFSRMTNEDEDATFHALQTCRDLIASSIETHGGRLVNSVGDAVLAVFGTVVEALTCATAIQRELEERNDTIPAERRIQLRMSVNLGDVIVDASQAIYGNGVNVAARLAALADPGGICIAESVYTAVGSKLPLRFEYIGERRVKNIADPIRTYRVILDPKAMRYQHWRRRMLRPRLLASIAAGLVVAAIAIAGAYMNFTHKPAALPSEMATRSIAVLPFFNSSKDESQEYLADGFTDDLITDLTRISGIFVIARDSSFIYKNTQLASQQVARELNVRYILEGSVRREGNQLRVNAQLMDSASGTNLWAERYDGKIDNILKLQDQITQRIVTALSLTLSSGERETVTRRDTNNTEAYQTFLKAQERYHRHSKLEILEARKLYRKSLELDPNFARAYAMLAMTYWFEFANAWSDDPEQSLASGQALAEKAIALNDAMPVAHFVSGLVYRERRQYAKALIEAEKAIALDPNYANGRVLLASVLYYAGRAEQGLAQMQAAIRLHPYHPHNYPFHLGQAYFILGDYDKAIGIFKDGMARNPTSQRLRLWLVASYAQAGNIQDAEWELDLLLTKHPELTLERIRQSYPFKYNGDLEIFVNALKKAGLST